MKRVIPIIICICLVVTGLFLINANFSKTHVIDSAKIMYYKDANAVIDDSVLIVNVRKLDEKPISYDLGEGHNDNFTLSSVQILDVYKQTDGFNYKIGNSITILESEWYNEADRTVHHTENYSKMKEGKTYTLYLSYNSSVDNFYPVGVLYGKIPEDKSESNFYGIFRDEQVLEVIDGLRDLQSIFK